jgi:hypothetical protein
MDPDGPYGSRGSQAAPLQEAVAPTERRPSRSLLRDGSLTAGLGGLALRSMSLGSQDLAGLLESSLHHMQTLSSERAVVACQLASPAWPPHFPS